MFFFGKFILNFFYKKFNIKNDYTLSPIHFLRQISILFIFKSEVGNIIELLASDKNRRLVLIS
jgi:hypothetical protein